MKAIKEWNSRAPAICKMSTDPVDYQAISEAYNTSLNFSLSVTG